MVVRFTTHHRNGKHTIHPQQFGPKPVRELLQFRMSQPALSRPCVGGGASSRSRRAIGGGSSRNMNAGTILFTNALELHNATYSPTQLFLGRRQFLFDRLVSHQPGSSIFAVPIHLSENRSRVVYR